MIVKANAKDKPLIHQYWKEVFAFDDGGSIDFFFNHYWQPENCFVLEKENEIVSACNVFKHDIMLHQKRISVSYLVGIFTRPKDQGKGYMKELVQGVLDIMSYQDLITVLMAYHPDIYKPFGFETVVSRREYQITRSMIPTLSTMGVTYQVENQQLLNCYQKFTRFFTGYKIRDVQYFGTIKADLEAQGGKLVAYIDQNKVQGYMMYIVRPLVVEVIEIIYFNTDTLYRLLNFAQTLKQRINIQVSMGEDLSTIFPKAVIEVRPFLMARLNDSVMFNELYNLQVTSAQQAYMALGAPLFFHEYQ